MFLISGGICANEDYEVFVCMVVNVGVESCFVVEASQILQNPSTVAALGNYLQ